MRELGIDTAHTFLENFGFSKSRLAPDLSLALGSSSFSPAEMIRAYNFLANSGKGENLYFIEKIIDRNNNIIFQHPRSQTELDDTQSIDGFPWFNEGLIEEIQPFNLLPMLKKQKQSIDTNVAFITKDILREALQTR